ncbi:MULTISPECIES: LysE family transporter [Paenibacillus]|uniref:LysE family transporter n=1 Tax=Paenibacillus TaxID=44249 RepID=UPI0006201AE1|nr:MULTISPECIES: LysE family transporter [Paenibacillus]KKC47679.1 amino acid transporter [Paenibacillus sp. D9]
MNAFLAYVLLGLSLSAPIGPINAAQLDKGARFGFTHAWLVGIGAMAADALYMLLIYFGVANFLATGFMRTLLFSFGFFVLMYTGLETLKAASPSLPGPLHEETTRAASFRSGFLMALLNPLNILFWLGIYGSLIAGSSHEGLSLLLLHSTGIFAGILLWDVVMAALASSLRRFASSRVLQGISSLAGLSLIGFGLYFGWQAFLQLTA